MLALKGWNTSKLRRTQTTLLPAESLKLTAVSSSSGSAGLLNMAALMLFAIESHSSSQRAWPKQALGANRDWRVFIFQMQSLPFRPFDKAHDPRSFDKLMTCGGLKAQS